MSELFLGLFIIGMTTGVIVAMAVVLGRKEDREAKPNVESRRRFVA